MQAIPREALPLPATPKGVTTYGQRNWLLFMLNGPRLNTVSYRTLGFPEYGMANVSNFTRCFNPASNPERGYNIIIGNEMGFYLNVKRAKGKNSVILYLRVPRVPNDQCKQFHARLYPASNPERGNSIWATKWLLSVLKGPRLKTVSYVP